MAQHPGIEPGTEIVALLQRLQTSSSYVVARLNKLAEELEASRTPADERGRLLRLVDEATAGLEDVGHAVRRLKALSWHRPDPVDVEDGDDTWESTGAGAKILVVDDETQILESVRNALRTYEVSIQASGLRAKELLASGAAFDLVIVDILMPDLSGIALHEWLVANRPELARRVLFMTAGAFSTKVRDFLASVANPVLHKPFDTKTLRWMVAQKLREDQGAAATWQGGLGPKG